MRETTWGIILVLASGLLYTLDRMAAMTAWGMMWAGYSVGGGPVPANNPAKLNIDGNGFVLFFLVAGLVLFAMGIANSRRYSSSVPEDVTDQRS